MLNKGYLACYKHNRLFQSNFTVKQDNANFIKYKDYIRYKDIKIRK